MELMCITTWLDDLPLDSWRAIRLLLLLLALPPVAANDVRERRIPLLIPALIAAVALPGLANAFVAVGAAVCGAAPLMLARAVTGRMGWGDVWLAASLGMLVGADRAIVASGYAAMLALASICLGRVLDGGWSSEASIPFGPYLIAGAICATVA